MKAIGKMVAQKKGDTKAMAELSKSSVNLTKEQVANMQR